MSEEQILKDMESIYQGALKEGKWNSALQAKEMQAKITGLFISPSRNPSSDSS